MFIRLKQLRDANNLTQKDIAIFLKITPPQYSLYETGKRPIPIFLLSRLAKFYNTSIDFLMDLTDEQKPYPAK